MVSLQDKVSNILEHKQQSTLRFCTKTEQILIQQMLTDKNVVHFDGGYPTSERKRAYFFQQGQGDITGFKIIYPEKQLNVTHQNILGTLLSLSITVDSIGDILPKQAVFFVISELKDEIKQSFTAINHVPIQLIEIDGELIQREQEFANFEMICDSLRLDLVVSKIAKISRKEANERILREWIKINHTVETKATKQLQEEDVISIRKSGRFIIDDATKRTKKGKIVVKYRKFI